MGSCGATLRQTTIDIIPDRDVMIGVVDRIVAFEELLKGGQPLSKAEEAELTQMKRVTKEMKRVNAKGLKRRAREGMMRGQ